MRVSKYWYNRSWHKLEVIANSPLVRLSFSIPLFGYLILFNDTVAMHLQFNELTSGKELFLIGGAARLKFVYFGLIFIALGSIWYRFRRPLVVRQAVAADSYVSFGIRNFVLTDFIDIFGDIMGTKSGPLTRYWESDETQLSAFIKDIEATANNPSAGRQQVLEQHSEFVRSLLLENYAQRARERKLEQIAILITCSLGYLLLAIPSFDLFISVFRSMF